MKKHSDYLMITVSNLTVSADFFLEEYLHSKEYFLLKKHGEIFLTRKPDGCLFAGLLLPTPYIITLYQVSIVCLDQVLGNYLKPL